MKFLARFTTAALVLAALAAPAAADPPHRAGRTPGFAQDMETLQGDAPYTAFVHFGSGTKAEQADVLRRHGLGTSMRFESIDVTYAFGRVRDFAALVSEPLVVYLEDYQEMTTFGDTGPWATRVRVAQRAAAGGPWRTPSGAIVDGSGVGVAVIDTGIDGDHPDLRSRMAKNFKVVCSTPAAENTQTGQCFGPILYQEQSDTDNAGHGTHVAGIVAGDGTASQGTFMGAAPGAKLFGFSWFEGATVGNLTAAASFEWVRVNGATQTPPIRIVTNSWGCLTTSGGCAYDPNLTVNKLTNQVVAQGVTVLWAVGNDGGTGTADVISGYAKNPTPGVIGVAGTFDQDTGNPDGPMYGSSSRGHSNPVNAANWPDIAAPAQAIISACAPEKPDCEPVWTRWAPNYSFLSGTSMSTPHVAGAAAMLLQANPSLTPAQVEDILLDNAYKVVTGGSYVADPQNPGGTTSFDKGAGLLNMPAALADARVGAGKDGVGRTGTPDVAITSPAPGDDANGTLSVTGTAYDGTVALGQALEIMTDPADYAGPAAADVLGVSLRDTAGGLEVTTRVVDVTAVPAGGEVRYALFYNVNGRHFRTSVRNIGTSVDIPGTGTFNTALATSVSRNVAANTVTFTVPFANIGNPPVNAPVHNAAMGSYAGAPGVGTFAQDSVPGGTYPDFDFKPQFGLPFTVRQVLEAPSSIGVSLAIDGGAPVAATVASLGGGNYSWSATLPLGSVPIGAHDLSATLRLNGVTRDSANVSFDVVATPTVPDAPQDLLATPGDATVSLAWSPPASNGGSPVTGYEVYRGTAPGSLTLLASPMAPAHVDTTAVNGTTYYYAVAARNAVGLSARSAEASATPAPPPLPAIGVSPSGIAFGASRVGVSTAPVTVTVTNGGGAPAAVASVSLGGANAADFSLSNACGSTLAAGASCEMEVTFTPTATGARNATVSVVTNAPGSPHQVTLGGTGTQGAFWSSTSAIDFGVIEVSRISSYMGVTVANVGTGPFVVDRLSIAGANAGDFLITGEDCGSRTLAPAEGCVATVAFAPTATGARAAELIVWHDAPGGPHAIALSGTGTTGLRIEPSSLAFPSREPGTSSAPKRVTVTNTAPSPVTLYDATSGSDDFAVTDGCANTTLGSGASCTIDVAFSPRSGGPSSTNLSIETTLSSIPRTVALSGYGIAPTVVLSEGVLDFGPQAVGRPSASRAVEIRNAGGPPLRLGMLALEGAAGYQITWDGCSGATVGAGSACEFRVSFAPVTAGATNASVRIPWNGGTSAVALTGTGVSDTTPPSSRFSTRPDSVVLVGGGVFGSTTEEFYGVSQVVVRFVGAGGTTSVVANLSCNAARSECTWSAAAPLLPGQYTVNARGTDGAGNAEDPGPSVRILVV